MPKAIMETTSDYSKEKVRLIITDEGYERYQVGSGTLKPLTGGAAANKVVKDIPGWIRKCEAQGYHKVSNSFSNGRITGILFVNSLLDVHTPIESMQRRDVKIYLKTLRKPASWNETLKHLVKTNQLNVNQEIQKAEKILGLSPGEEVY
jgi:hypothetical protein